MQTEQGPRREEWGAWAGWAVAQGCWLGCMAGRVRLSAKWPEAGEVWSGMGMVAVQLVLASAMGQALLKDLRSWVYASALAGPMLGLAVVQGGFALQEAWAAILCLMVWLGVFASIGAIRVMSIQSVLKTVMLVLTVGGPILLYLVGEFGRRAMAWEGVIAYVSPILGVLVLLEHGWDKAWVMGFPLGFLILIGAMRYRSQRQKMAGLKAQ